MLKRNAPTMYFVLCSLEGVWSLGALLSLPRSGSTGGILGYSPVRVGLIAATVLLIALFAYLALRERRAETERTSLVGRLLAQRSAVLLAGMLFVLGLAAFYLFALSPLRVEALHAYTLRFHPLFLWMALIVAQFFILALLVGGSETWAGAWRELSGGSAARRLRGWTGAPAAGYTLLALAFLIGLSKLYYGRFVDEADNLTTGWLISQGYSLYKDVFSHHFPFPYYWVALVVSAAGSSFAAVRVSMLLLQAGLFAASMRFSRFYLATGLASLAWSLTNQFHRGQEAIYASFEAIFMTAAFIVITSLLVRRSPPSRTALAYSGVLLALGVLTDPLMVYPAAVGLAAVFTSGWIARKGQEGLRRLLWAGGAAALVMSIYALYLLASGTTADFYRETIWFNAEIYAKYEDADPNRLGGIAANLATGLDVLDPRWREETSPFLPLDTYRSVRLEDEAAYGKWIFAGLLFRASILACALGLILSRRAAAALYLYIYSAALLVRASDGLYAMGFALLSLFAAFYLITNLRRPVLIQALKRALKRAPKRVSSRRGERPSTRAWVLAQAGWTALVVLLVGMQAWSALRGGYYLADHWGQISNKRHVVMFHPFGDEIHELTCNQDGVELSVFPINPIVHFVTGIPPASKYTFMYPWVAEVGQQELIAELRENPNAVVWIKTGRKSGSPEGVAAYMADTIEFLDREYVVMGDDFWMSPALAERCPVTPGKIPFTQDDES